MYHIKNTPTRSFHFPFHMHTYCLLHPPSPSMAIKRAEIDTTAPFASVREAVALFADRALPGHVYASNITTQAREEATDRNANPTASRIGAATAELQQTSQSLKKAREDSVKMADSLSSLKQELETTKRELRRLKEIRPPHETPLTELEIVEESAKFRTETTPEFQKRRYVTFANPPSKVVEPPPQEAERLERHPSLRRKSTNNKKKAYLIPLIGGIFGKRRQSHELP